VSKHRFFVILQIDRNDAAVTQAKPYIFIRMT
jgi:hypothetical protein